MATYSSPLKRFSSGPLQGIALGLYFALLPYVVLAKWRVSQHEADGVVIRILLIALSVFWITFFANVIRNVLRLRRGTRLNTGGSAWLAGLVVALLPFLLSGTSGASAVATNARVSDHAAVSNVARHPSHVAKHPLPLGTPLSSSALVPLALMAKRRSDQLQQQDLDTAEDQVDDVVALLRHRNTQLLGQLRHLIGDATSGVVVMPLECAGLPESDLSDAVVITMLHHDAQGTSIAFAREGGELRVNAHQSRDAIESSCVALHQGKMVFEDTLTGLLRSLATRAVRRTVVVFLGDAHAIDEELRASCITVKPVAQPRGDLTYQFAGTSRADPLVSTHAGDVRVELLRADPRITGMSEPFVAALRRRCIEMVAYLALHRNEPVTGDRLRSRVLNYANVDASSRTLANTASAVRRSLGATSDGPRLHSVSSSGLYTSHGVTSDVESFHALVGRARTLPSSDAAPLAHEALQLIHGEPLASALRGFEWFLAEGYFARLQRDAEWAALVLHHESMRRAEYEVAFWSLNQGLLVDPYSDALRDALARVPRSRQFGGDGTGGAKDQTIGTSGTVAVGWTFNRFVKQVSQ